MTKLHIAGILMDVDIDSHEARRLNMFISHCPDDADIKILQETAQYINVPEEKAIIDEGIRWMRKASSGRSLTAYIYDDYSEAMAAFEVDDYWKDGLIICSQKGKYSEWGFSGSAGDVLFRNLILHHHGIVVHASAIEWEGKGIIFSAPSGVGKSTQSNLWKRHMNAKILNDDRPAVRMINEQPFLYGTPWSGSSAKFLNKSVPLKAIVLLEQSPEDRIEKLSGYEPARQLLPRCFLPYYDMEYMKLALDTIEKIIASVPVYALKCKPDKDAVELVRKCVG